MSNPYSKEAKAGHDRKLKAYGGQSGNAPLTHAGFPALNTDTQAGRAPLNSPNYIPPEVTPRMGRKKGGKVMGAQSLKRLDKSPRKGAKIPTGTRAGEIPSGTTEQVEFDPTLKFEPGKMSEAAPRKKGGMCGMKKGGMAPQDYEDRSHESQGAQGLRKRQAHAKGGKAEHDDEAMDRALIKKMVKPQDLTGKSCGGRTKKAAGGSLSGLGEYGLGGGSDGKSSGGKKGASKSVVNIMIGGMPGQQPQQPGIDPMLLAAMAQGGPQGGPPPMAPPGAPPAGAPPMAPPPAMAPPPPMPPQAGPGGPPPMPRKDGGSVQVPYKKPGRKDDYPAMDFGSGGGFGRLQKKDSYGTKGPKGDSV